MLSLPHLRGARTHQGSGTTGFLKSRPVLAICLILLGLVVLVALFGTWLYPHDPLAVDPAAGLLSPSADHPLGTDRYGRDLLSRLIYGARISLGVATGSILVALIIGGLLGLVVGYAGGWADQVVMRGLDVLFALPSMLLAIVLAVALGPSAVNAGIAIAIIYVPVFARVTRGAVLVEMGKDYPDAFRSMGASPRRIVIRHILPNISTPLTVQAAIGVANAILLESALSFLGLGAQPPAASWGSVLGEGRVLMLQAPWIVLASAAVLILTVLLLFIVSDGLRDLLDPRSR